MLSRIKLLSPILILPLFIILSPAPASAQRQKKTDKQLLTNLDIHIRYLSEENGEMRKTGTAGEKRASDYIASEFTKAGLQPRGDNGGWLQAFDIEQGREVSGDAYFMINDHPLLLNQEYFPLAFSAIASVTGSPAMALQESGVPWFLDLRDLLEAEGGLNEADLPGIIRSKAASFAKKGATALIVFNSSKTADNLAFDPKDNSEPASIPVIYITAAAKRKYLRDESASVDIRIKTGFAKKKSTGHNVLGYLDNGASSTVVIGAHYDYRGSAGDSVSSHSGGNRDNAGGVAAVIELARLLTGSRLKGNNYLFVAFSGGEQGYSGSKFMADHPPIDRKQLNYMLDLDRIEASTDNIYPLIVGGYGSSPSWWGACREAQAKPAFAIHLDSTYSGAGDQSPFYTMDIPALVFYTGADKPDHGLELELVKYVFDIVKAADGRGRLAFTKSRS